MATSSRPPLRRKQTGANLFRSTMTRFLKKKVPEPLGSNNETANSSLAGSPSPMPLAPPLKKSTSRWRRNRKPIEQRPVFNLDLALPSEADFRTSLFMPGLVARFSMLREQDDPNSILGKASDDSVLQPRRRSRMDFGLARGGLDDIAEVASMRSTKSSLPPPITDRRQDSFATEDGNDSENDSPHSSIMSRSRRGEGNTLFGGRQKVSIIPKGGAGSTRNVGRTLYEDDSKTTSFHSYSRAHEGEDARSSDEGHGFDFGLDQTDGTREVMSDDANTTNDSGKDLSDSPSLSSSENKWSTHSTHSEARSSTAATSIASQPVTSTTSPTKSKTSSPPTSAPTSVSSAPSTQPPKRSDTKTRRLYESGLDQHMHEQQTSALTRLNSLHRQHTLSNKHPPLHLHSVKSASNIYDKARQPVYALSEQNSPTVGPISDGASPIQSPTLSPLPSQYGMDFNEYNTLTQALEPGDRGKATAMGAFNKPKQSFDEQQYLERQRQLQRSASNAATKKGLAAKAASRSSPTNGSPQQGTIESNASEESRSSPQSASTEPMPKIPDNILHQPPSQTKPQQNTQIVGQALLPDVYRPGDIKVNDTQQDEDLRTSNKATFRPPDYGYGTHHGKWQPTVLPSVLEHPAFRFKNSKASPVQKENGMQPSGGSPAQPSNEARTDLPKIQTPAEDAKPATPVANKPAEPLSGFVQHLRQKSNLSSTTQNTDRTSLTEATSYQELTSQNLDLVNAPAQSATTPDSRAGSFANSNPWDLDEVDNVVRADNRASHASISPIDGEHHIGPLDSRFASFNDRQSAVSELDLDDGKDISSPQDGTTTQHNRDSSTATQQDRAAFDNELAARANVIQEKLKSKVEGGNQSRGVSPARSISGGFKAFSILRSQPAGESIEPTPIPETPPNAPAKALKILGSTISNEKPSSSTSNSRRPSNGQDVEPSRPREDSDSTPPVPSIDPRILQQGELDTSPPIQQIRSRENSEIEPFPTTSRSPRSSAVVRSRANSVATTGRSRSRTGPYRDDLEKAMVEGMGTSAATVSELATIPHRELTPRSTPEINQSPFEPPRARSGSRAGMTSYFDNKSLNPIMTGSRERLSPGIPSPALTPNPYSPMLCPSPLSPAGSFAHNMTPPLSGASTPLQSSFTPPPIPSSSSRSGGILRKKTISKGDISEPTLISSTSNIDLVDLPEGSSLKNGMDEPPPVPPLNPARRATKRILGLGRKESSESTTSHGSRSRTPDVAHKRTPESDLTLNLVKSSGSRSDTQSPQKPSSGQSFGQDSTTKSNGLSPNLGSPPGIERAKSPPIAVGMDGGMF